MHNVLISSSKFGPPRNIGLAAVLLIWGTQAHATETDVPYAPILQFCYDASETPDALQACIGQLANACKEGEEGGWSTLGISQCNLAEAQVWDTYLNDVYQQALATFREWDKAEAQSTPQLANANANAADALRDAQTAWIAFRESECSLAYAFWGSGSMRNIAASECQLQMTAERVIDLRALMETR